MLWDGVADAPGRSRGRSGTVPDGAIPQNAEVHYVRNSKIVKSGIKVVSPTYVTFRQLISFMAINDAIHVIPFSEAQSLLFSIEFYMEVVQTPWDSWNSKRETLSLFIPRRFDMEVVQTPLELIEFPVARRKVYFFPSEFDMEVVQAPGPL